MVENCSFKFFPMKLIWFQLIESKLKLNWNSINQTITSDCMRECWVLHAVDKWGTPESGGQTCRSWAAAWRSAGADCYTEGRLRCSEGGQVAGEDGSRCTRERSTQEGSATCERSGQFHWITITALIICRSPLFTSSLTSTVATWIQLHPVPDHVKPNL